MKPTGPRHAVAALREIIGLSQREFAALVRRSPRTIQAIEINRLRLSEELARIISNETGVAYEWLVDGKPEAQPWTLGNRRCPYTKEMFERTRSLLSRGKNPSASNLLSDDAGKWGDFALGWTLNFPQLFSDLAQSLYAATETGRGAVAHYRLSMFAKEFRREFGCKIDGEFLEWYEELIVIQLWMAADGRQLLERTGPVFWSPHVPRSEWSENRRELSDDELTLWGPERAQILAEKLAEMMRGEDASTFYDRLKSRVKSTLSMAGEPGKRDASSDVEAAPHKRKARIPRTG